MLIVSNAKEQVELFVQEQDKRNKGIPSKEWTKYYNTDEVIEFIKHANIDEARSMLWAFATMVDGDNGYGQWESIRD